MTTEQVEENARRSTIRHCKYIDQPTKLASVRIPLILNVIAVPSGVFTARVSDFSHNKWIDITGQKL